MDKLELQQKRAEIALKKAQTIKEKTDAISTEEKLKIEKMKELHDMIASITVDEEKQIPGCEMVFKPVYTEKEQFTLKQKLFDIVKTL
jgi:hypothetical protein